ncbi:hypothetical protein KSF_008360 [Reticulibacter mediterranei]|uniref:TIR domain-containing protein n=1 Tax=Reticulibacter mediterranei TaxID=2778369 RepID=A0A8J3MZT7_9CHLR|nr:TIR domain-containing protein [Reticulibacter mediterranei]GHO90788.1 hypothetical protein KSF_008360 [Reticulibacter mediterranei]
MHEAIQNSGFQAQIIGADVLLVTVTEVETRSVLNLFKKYEKRFRGNKTYYELGIIGGARTYLMQAEMGPLGANRAFPVVLEGIKVLSPLAVVIIGLAFGVNSSKQRIGEILVSRQILDYELQRVDDDIDGKAEIILRDHRPEASARLLDRFRDGSLSWEGPKAHLGYILSGAKLSDGQDFSDQLRKLELEAIGGEMEGAGLYAAAQRNKVDWIVVKAICDWADGKKYKNKHLRQKKAADNVANFVVHVLKQGGFSTGVLPDGQYRTSMKKNGNDEFAYDVFVSYSYEDRPWVRGTLLPTLEAQGLRVCIDFRDFVAGTPSVSEMERVIQSSRKTLLVLTPDYLKSSWSEFEYLMLLTLDPTNLERRLIPLLKAECDLPLRIRYLTYVSFTEPEVQSISWTKLLNTLGVVSKKEPTTEIALDESASFCKEDRAGTINTEIFYGRKEELARLMHWIIDDDSQVVALLGMGGIGKTSLAAKLAERIKNNFDYFFWRDIKNGPLVEDVLGDCIKFLANQEKTGIPHNVDQMLSMLFEYLRKYHCLLVLDNAESILLGGERAGYYREGYEGYGELIRRMGETSHKSCLLITSREKPKDLASLGNKIKSMRLNGLSQVEGKELLKNKELFGTDEGWITLVNRYTGNPLALKIAAMYIQELFHGDIDSFLVQNSSIFGDIRNLLDQQLDRLTELEERCMHWLAIEREPMLLNDFKENIGGLSTGELFEALGSLQRRSMIESSGIAYFTLQPAIMEYITDRLIRRIAQEINTEAISSFKNYALMKAQAKDYIRESQVRLILKPIADRLRSISSKKSIEDKLIRILSRLRQDSPLIPGYAGGNVLNLFRQLKTDFSNHDFSYLTVWQAYLRDVRLHRVNFTHSDLTNSVFTEAFGSIPSVAFSPNGKLLAAATANGEIRLWQEVGSKQILSYEGHSDWIRSVAFSPDGNMLASSSSDQTVGIWDVYTGQRLKILQGHKSQVWSVAFSPDGNILASGSDDQTVRLWDVQTGQCTKILKGHTGRVRSVTISFDGSIIASGSGDQTIRLWDLHTGKSLMTLQGHTRPIWSVAFSPDGNILASGSDDQTVRLWDVQTGQCTKILKGHINNVWSVSFSPTEATLASGSHDQAVRLWDIRTGQCLKILEGHTNWVESVAFSPDGNILASGSDDQTVRLWDVQTGQCIRTVQGYTNPVWSISVSPDGKTLASGSSDQAVRLWDTRTGQCLKILEGHTNWVWSVAFSPDGTTLASGSGDCTVRLWDVRTGQCLKVLEGHMSRVRSVAFSPDGTTLASGSGDCTVRLWDTSRKQCLKTMEGHTNWVEAVAFNSDGSILATSSDDQTVRLWNIHTGKCLILEGHTGPVWSVAFSPDGSILASGSSDQTVRLWDVYTGLCLKSLEGHSNTVRTVSFNIDGGILASGGGDRTVRLWNVHTGQCFRNLHLHSNSVRCVTFDSSGQILISSSEDETIKLWDMKTGEILTSLRSARPYEGMNISGAIGLTQAQKLTLKALGAVEELEKKSYSQQNSITNE